MKYEIGNKARVKTSEKLRETRWEITDGMEKLSGQIVTISMATGEYDSQPYKILEDGGVFWWAEDLFEPLTLKEQYFQTGYVVEFRDGDKYIVLRDGDKIALAEQDGQKSWSSWRAGELFDDDLLHESLAKADIMKVYPQVCRWKGPLGNPIWQREEPKEMTIEEIEKLVGTKVKIVSDQKGRE